MRNNHIKAFLEFVSARLWEKEARHSQYGKADYKEIFRLSEEQILDGLVGDYRKAINYLKPLSSEVFQDAKFSMSYGLVIDDRMVELHGTLRCGLSSKTVRETDRVQRDVFYGGDVRSCWDA